MPAEGTGISWLEAEQPLSLCPQSLALDFDLLCSRLELVYKQGFGLGSLLLHRGGDREPGQALGFSTLLRLSQPLRISLRLPPLLWLGQLTEPQADTDFYSPLVYLAL